MKFAIFGVRDSGTPLHLNSIVPYQGFTSAFSITNTGVEVLNIGFGKHLNGRPAIQVKK